MGKHSEQTMLEFASRLKMINSRMYYMDITEKQDT